jgi:DNA-directed RNA polymerase specialized sigma24 family protein
MNDAERASLTQNLARLAAGDRSASTPVFETLWPVLVSFCRRYLGGATESEDCAQRAMIKIFDQSAFFDVTKDALTWALALSLWECRSVRKLAARHRARAGTECLESLPHESTPMKELEQAQLKAALHEAIGDLPVPAQHEIAHYLSGEVAGDATARKRRQRALETLRVLWRRIHGE